MKHPQSSADYQRHLEDAINALELSSAAYDRGYVGEAMRLAATIRVLVHDTSASQSLLQQMNLKQDLKYYATPNPYDVGNLLTECHLVIIAIGGGSMRYMPILDNFPPVFKWEQIAFEKWWTQGVVRDNRRRVLSRRDLVLALANTDGGAHVDPRLDAVYADLSRKNSLAWKMVTGGIVADPTDGPHFACVRQIAHELRKTLSQAPDIAASRGKL